MIWEWAGLGPFLIVQCDGQTLCVGLCFGSWSFVKEQYYCGPGREKGGAFKGKLPSIVTAAANKRLSLMAAIYRFPSAHEYSFTPATSAHFTAGDDGKRRLHFVLGHFLKPSEVALSPDWAWNWRIVKLGSWGVSFYSSYLFCCFSFVIKSAKRQ